MEPETRGSSHFSARQPRFRVPSVPYCMLAILLVKLALKAVGFGRTLGWIRQRVEGVPLVEDVGVELARGVERSVAIAGALYPGRALCLEQSLVLYYVLRKGGVAAEFHIGAQAHPFLAHAWVQHRGEPINDVAEHVRRFAPLF